MTYMNGDAVAWAFAQNVKSPSAKWVLMSLCRHANHETGRAFPSIAAIGLDTELNRKSIISALKFLERKCLIHDTGEREGKTRQIKVYRTAFETVPKSEQYHNRNSSAPTEKQCQKRDTEDSKGNSNILPPPPQRRSGKHQPIPVDWVLPSIQALPPEAKAYAQQWPAGAYQVEGEAFASYHRGKGGRHADWAASWAS